MFKYIKFTKVTDEFATHEFREMNEKCKVNIFDVPYVSVEYTDESDFIELMTNQSPLIQAIEITKEEFASAVSNSSQLIRMHDRANDLLKTLSLEIIAKYSIYEIITWGIQTEEARRVLAGDTDVTILGALAQSEGDTVENFANAVLAKKAEFEQLCAVALTQKRAFLSNLKAEVGL